MKKYQYLISPQISKIESNREYIPYFSFGDWLKESHQSVPANIEISFNITKDLSRSPSLIQKFQSCYGSDFGDEIYYERKLGLGMRGKMHLKNILKGAEIVTNNAYFKYVRIKMDNVYPPGVHLTDILSVNLLERGYAPLHCGAVSSENNGLLFIAPPDTGKSITTFLALKRGFHYLSEDISVVDEGNVYSIPNTSTFLNHDKNHKSFRSLLSSIPLLGYYIRPSKKSITNAIKDFRVEERAKIKRLFILDRGKANTTEKIDPEEALRRIVIINRNEFSFHKNPLLFAYAYFNPVLNINKLMGKEQNIFRAIVEKTECFLLKAIHPKDYIDLAMKSD